jgi:DNA-binding HxlR family transcriptional regulator
VTSSRKRTFVPQIFTSNWDPALVIECARGVHRFDQLQQRTGISRKVLAERLRQLVDQDVLTRERYQSRPERFEYHLTEKGVDLLPVLLAMTSWDARWSDEEQVRSLPAHSTCGWPCSATISCTHCQQELHGTEIVLAD